MPAVPSSIIEPIWDQFAALLPAHQAPHPLGCHRARIPDRLVVDKLVPVSYTHLTLPTIYSV